MKRDYKQFFAICKTHGLEYKEVVYQFTEGLTDSLSSLTDEDYYELEDQIKALNKPSRDAYKNYVPPPGDAQRKYMIGLARDMRWVNPVEDLKKWVLKQKYKKPLMKHSPAELSVLISILEKEVKPSFYKGYNK